MTSESNDSFQDFLDVDQQDFFDFDAYYGEGSHHEHHSSLNPINNTAASAEFVDQHNNAEPATTVLGQLDSDGAAPLFLSTSSWQDGLIGVPADQPMSLLANGGQAGKACHVGCASHGLSFNRNADFERHMQAMHGSASYPCPHDTCPAHTHNFKRKDKLQEHIRMKHADLLAKCIHAHCTAKTSHLLYHRQEDHGAYECTLDHCGGAARSYFTESKLDKHLRDHHKMSRGVCKTVMDVLEKMSEKTVHDRHLPTSTRVKRWVNCTVCPSVIQQAQVGQMAALGAADVEGQYYQ